MVLTDVQLILPNGLGDCPEYWQNFIHSLRPDPHLDVDEYIIENTLRINYNAVPYFSSNMVKFATCDDLTFFVLSWS
jgi:hypothetical protein